MAWVVNKILGLKRSREQCAASIQRTFDTTYRATKPWKARRAGLPATPFLTRGEGPGVREFRREARLFTFVRASL